jgi:uncharacterized repeat protein (TIGR01451 family)
MKRRRLVAMRYRPCRQRRHPAPAAARRALGPLSLAIYALLLALLGAIAGVALDAGPADAQVVRTFTPRYTINNRGDIRLIGNTLMSCSGGGQCNQARNGSSSRDNNDFNMQYVDVDGDGSTFCSSRATLTLPVGTTVLFAGLYWAGDSNNAARNQARFSTPITGYQTVVAIQIDANGTAYQGFRDVTALVQAGGNGSYTVANVQSTTGTNRFAGWSLIVAYADPTVSPRNLVVFDGYAHIAPGATVNTAVAGFLTPPAGAVTTLLGVVASEGDRNLTGDSFRLNATSLADVINPATNFFNGTISQLGAHITAKNPNYVNQLGFDIDLVSANGVLPNGSTGATITLTSSGDRYYPGAFTFATDLYAPVLQGTSFTKSVTDLNGPPARPGDVMEYTITMTNTGLDAAVQSVLRDPLPPSVSFVSGSLSIASGANAGAKTDAGGDDQGEYESGLHRVSVRLGTGANATTGGTLPPAASTSVTFRVRVDDATPHNTVVGNQGQLAYLMAQIGTADTTESDGDVAAPGEQPTTFIVVVSTAVTGNVYDDRDHDAVYDAAEPGLGVPLWAKLIVATAPLVAQQVVPVDSSSGGYSFSGITAGSYTVVLDINSLPADVTPGTPAGWLATEAPSGSRAAVVVGSTSVTGVDFGLWHGSRVSGTTFRDDGAGGGAANDGVHQAGEAATSGLRVRLASAACAGVCDSTITGAGGAFTLWTPFVAIGVPATIAETNAASWVSTGASAGTTAGSYARAADELSFTPAGGIAYSSVAFGDVPPSTFVPSGAQSVTPGGVALYAHTFTAGSPGAVSFAAVQTPSPVLPGWTLGLYRDLDCDGAIDSGEPLVAAPITLAAGGVACVVARHGVPVGAPSGAAEQVGLTASYSYTGAAPAFSLDHLVGDLTTVVIGSLALSKTVDRVNAQPGDTLTYVVTYQNLGPEPLTNIEIRDATPSYTVFVTAVCGLLGSGLGACGVTQEPAVGGTGTLAWTLGGALLPGGSGTVSFRVRIP